jgi:hypothetical protein
VQNERRAKVSVLLGVTLCLTAVTACGGGGHRDPPSVGALSAWQDAAIGYDTTLDHCVGDAPYGGHGFWSRCIGRYRRTYVAAAGALVRATSHCGPTSPIVRTLVARVSAAYQLAWVAGQRFVRAAAHFSHGNVSGPRVGLVLQRADATRARAMAAIPSLVTALRRTCA